MFQNRLIVYGLVMGAGVLALRVTEYHFVVAHLSLQLYLAAVAVLFTLVGAWITTEYHAGRTRPQPVSGQSESLPGEIEISRRELEVLALMAEGYSNKEIADRLYVSLNTVKTHAANLYGKLDVRRRTQAVSRARELNLIPR